MKVYLAYWTERNMFTGFIGVYDNMDKAENAIDEDKELYPDDDVDYDIIEFYLNETVDNG